MTQTIKIKRSTTTAAPGTLSQGELAYSDSSSKLFIGSATNGTVLTIGGKLYTDMLDHAAGTLTANSAVIVDANSKIDVFNVDNLRLDGNTLSSVTGDVQIVPFSGTLDIDSGTINLSSQATQFSILDNSATSITFSEGNNNYLTLDTSNAAEKIILNKQVTFGLDGTAAYTLPTVDGINGQALITDGNGTVTFTDVSTTLTVDVTDDTTTADVELLTDDLQFTGGEGIDLTVSKVGTDITLTITGELASSSNIGVASFDATDFTVTAGNVAVNTITLGTSSLNAGETTLSLAGLESLSVDNITVDGNDISSTNANGNISITPNGEGVINVPSGYKDRANFGTNSLVSKEYVDAVQQGLDVKESVRLATTGNLSATYNNAQGTLTNSGALAALSLDSVTVVLNDRVLVKDQTSTLQNGIYNVTTVGDGSTAWVLTRSVDADEGSDLTGGTFTFVEEGTLNADNGYVFTHNGTPTLGTTPLPVSQFSGAGQITAGEGLSKLGNTLDVNVDDITIEINADILRLKGVTSTSAGDLIYGVAANGGYSSLAAPTAGTVTANDFILSMDTSGNPLWANVLDGGTY